MPKAISNLNATQDKNTFPSKICKLTAEGKISPDQLYCCSDSDCTPQFDLNTCYPPQVLSQCRNIDSLDACKRTDANADRVCEWKGDHFCLTEGSTVNFRSNFFKSIEWMVSRNTLSESINATDSSGKVTACYNGTDYQLSSGNGCNLDGSVTCGDLFSKDYICNWRNFTTGESINRQPLGEVCEKFAIPTVTSETTIFASNNSSLKIGLGIGIGAGLSIIICGISGVYFFWKFKKNVRIPG